MNSNAHQVPTLCAITCHRLRLGEESLPPFVTTRYDSKGSSSRRACHERTIVMDLMKVNVMEASIVDPLWGRLEDGISCSTSHCCDVGRTVALVRVQGPTTRVLQNDRSNSKGHHYWRFRVPVLDMLLATEFYRTGSLSTTDTHSAKFCQILLQVG